MSTALHRASHASPPADVLVVSGTSSRRRGLVEACRRALPAGRVAEVADWRDVLLSAAAQNVLSIVLDRDGLPELPPLIAVLLRGMNARVVLLVVQEEPPRLVLSGIDAALAPAELEPWLRRHVDVRQARDAARAEGRPPASLAAPPPTEAGAQPPHPIRRRAG